MAQIPVDKKSELMKWLWPLIAGVILLLLIVWFFTKDADADADPVRVSANITIPYTIIAAMT